MWLCQVPLSVSSAWLVEWEQNIPSAFRKGYLSLPRYVGECAHSNMCTFCHFQCTLKMVDHLPMSGVRTLLTLQRQAIILVPLFIHFYCHFVFVVTVHIHHCCIFNGEIRFLSSLCLPKHSLQQLSKQ